MMNVPERLTSVSHPLVSSIYLKKNYEGSEIAQDILVIETNFSHENTDDGDFDECLSELLGDLQNLRIQAESKIGHFDRVDIRTS